MSKKFYSSTLEDPYFLAIGMLLKPLIREVEKGDPCASKKAVELMLKTITRVHISMFKDPAYTKQVFKAVKLHLELGNTERITKIARTRKTDRLAMIRSIACDTLEYFAFLPIKLKSDPTIIRRYAANMDNALWLLRRARPDKNWIEILSRQLEQL